MDEHKIIKQYLAIIKGEPKPDEGEINIPIVERNIRGHYKMMLSPSYSDLTKLILPKNKRENIESSSAKTKYRVLDTNYGVSLIECQPVTGSSTRLTNHFLLCLKMYSFQV